MADLRLSLEHMTVLGLKPGEIIAAGEALGVDHVSLILDTGSYPLKVYSFLESPGLVDEIVSMLCSSPVSVHAAEGFLFDGDTDFDRLQRLLDLSARLGVERGVVMVVDADRPRVVDQFARRCELARPYGLQVSLEFVAMTPVATLDDAREIIEASGAGNGAISIDLLHLTRAGGVPADLAAPGIIFGAAQLCDGLLSRPRDEWEYEGVAGRLIPGEGEFPIASFLAALPAGLVVGVETPMGLPADPALLLAAASRGIAAARRATGRFV